MDPIIPIIGIFLGALGNGLYDIVIKGSKRLGRRPRLERQLSNALWERLYKNAGLEGLVQRYRREGSREALIALGQAMWEALQEENFKPLATTWGDLKL